VPRILTYDYFASTHPQAKVVHMISHERTKLLRGRHLTLHIEGICLNVIAAKHLALLSEQDAKAWVKGYGGLAEQFGRRRACKNCWDWAN